MAHWPRITAHFGSLDYVNEGGHGRPDLDGVSRDGDSSHSVHSLLGNGHTGAVLCLQPADFLSPLADDHPR